MRDAKTLKRFRCLGLLLMAAELWRYFGARGEGIFVWPEVLFSAFEWYPRPGRVLAHFLGPIMGGCLIFAAFGRAVRPALGLFLVLYGYTLGLVLSDYNNHHYLYWLVALCFFAIGPVGDTVPPWTYALLRFQVLVVFLFAALAKLNLEWLQGLPLKVMLAARGVQSEELALALSLGGILVDLVMAPLLLVPRARVAAAASLVVFHLANATLFDIATFPFFMIVTLMLFWGPDKIGSPQAVDRRWKGLIIAYVVVQLLLPLRHHLIPGDVNWDRGGHRLAWRMMLNHNLGETVYHLEDEAGNTQPLAFPYSGLHPNQMVRLSFEPDSIWRYGRWLLGRDGVSRVRVATLMSWNGREREDFFQENAEVTLDNHPYDFLRPSPRHSEPWYLVLLQFSLLVGWMASVGRKLYGEAFGSEGAEPPRAK